MIVGAKKDFPQGAQLHAHPVATAPVLAVIRIRQRDDLVEKAAHQGEQLLARLQVLAETRPLIGAGWDSGLRKLAHVWHTQPPARLDLA